MTLRSAWLLTAMSVLTPGWADAQLQSRPVYPHAVLGRGLSMAVDYGRDLNASVGVAQHVGARATVHHGRGSVEVGIGLRDGGTDRDLQTAASAGLRLLGGGPAALGLGLQVGVGYLRSGAGATRADHLALPVTLGIALPALRAGAAGLRPWIAPLVQLNRVAFAQVIVNQPGAGGSAGVDIGLPGRVGFHLGLQWSRFADRRTTGVTLFGGSQVTLGAGAHVTLGAGRRAPAG